MSPAGQQRRSRTQQITLIYAVMTCLLILVVAQFVLLLVSVEGFQRGERDVLLPATLASGLCFGAGGWLIRYILPRGDSSRVRR
jgi:hypothetical protein